MRAELSCSLSGTAWRTAGGLSWPWPVPPRSRTAGQQSWGGGRWGQAAVWGPVTVPGGGGGRPHCGWAAPESVGRWHRQPGPGAPRPCQPPARRSWRCELTAIFAVPACDDPESMDRGGAGGRGCPGQLVLIGSYVSSILAAAPQPPPPRRLHPTGGEETEAPDGAGGSPAGAAVSSRAGTQPRVVGGRGFGL